MVRWPPWTRKKIASLYQTDIIWFAVRSAATDTSKWKGVSRHILVKIDVQHDAFSYYSEAQSFQTSLWAWQGGLFSGEGGGACLKSFAAKMFAPKIFAELYVCSKKFCGYRILLWKSFAIIFVCSKKVLLKRSYANIEFCRNKVCRKRTSL